MHAIARVSLLTLVLGLSACAVHHPQPQPTAPTIPSLPQTTPTPRTGTPLPVTPSTPSSKPIPRTSASFAPPPGGASHWEPKLGVYVLEGQDNTYYRQRTYYRWDGGWSWATSLNGPWQSTDTGGVPPGLGRLHSQ